MIALETLKSQPAVLLTEESNQAEATDPIKPDVETQVSCNTQTKNAPAAPGRDYDEKTRSVLVRGCIPKVSEIDFYEHFMQFGKIVNIRKVLDRAGCQITFIKYEAYEAAEKAICEFQNMTICE